MRGRPSVAIALAALAAWGVLLPASCMLFTGSTNGYSSDEGGSGGGSCMSAASCGGDAGMVCCLIVNAATTSTAGTCQESCSAPSYPQLCAMNAECGDAGPCTMQSCTVDAGGYPVTVSLQACGTVPGCKP
jgi:hypothetical protein